MNCCERPILSMTSPTTAVNNSLRANAKNSSSVFHIFFTTIPPTSSPFYDENHRRYLARGSLQPSPHNIQSPFGPKPSSPVGPGHTGKVQGVHCTKEGQTSRSTITRGGPAPAGIICSVVACSEILHNS